MYPGELLNWLAGCRSFAFLTHPEGKGVEGERRRGRDWGRRGGLGITKNTEAGEDKPTIAQEQGEEATQGFELRTNT